MPAGTLWVGETNASHLADINLAPDLSRGVVLVQRRGVARLVVGPLHEESSGLVAVSPYGRPTVGFALLLPIAPSPAAAGKDPASSSASVGASVEHLELSLPGHALLSSASLHSVNINVQELVVQRAAAVHLSIDGILQVDGSARNLRAEMTTFVRDVVTAAALSEGVAPKLGADSAMPPESKTR